jgi:fluoroacetyl-CoA thioesterase
MSHDDMSADATLVVAARDTACNIGLTSEDSFPEVFATSRMIALMEVAAARAMRPLLGDGQHSVGVGLNVKHCAATPVGSRVRAVARWLRNEGRLMHFNVQAFDEAGLIGEGEHTRAIVDTARLLTGAEKRRGTDPNSTNR